MTSILKAIPWAILILLFAAGERSGIIERRSAELMLAILPALAVISATSCGLFFRLLIGGRRELGR